MPLRVNGIWRVSWCEMNNGIVKVMLDLNTGQHPQYFVGNVLREYGEPKVGEMYRLILEPAFPHELNKDTP